MHIERWKWIPGYECRYEVSNLGRVRSYAQTKPRILKPGRMPSGHLSVALGEGNSQCVHKLVLTAFNGPPKKRQECRHLDGDPSNNQLVNLVWGTRGENSADKKWHSKAIKLTVDQVRHIKKNKGVISAKTLAIHHCISKSGVYAIWQGKYHNDV